MSRIRQTYGTLGITGFYRGGTALMLRQGSNWASRQGLTDMVRSILKKRHGGDQASVKLSAVEEALAGIIGLNYCYIYIISEYICIHLQYISDLHIK